MARIANDIMEIMGNKPFVRLSKMSEGLEATVVAKPESFRRKPKEVGE